MKLQSLSGTGFHGSCPAKSPALSSDAPPHSPRPYCLWGSTGSTIFAPLGDNSSLERQSFNYCSSDLFASEGENTTTQRKPVTAPCSLRRGDDVSAPSVSGKHTHCDAATQLLMGP